MLRAVTINEYFVDLRTLSSEKYSNAVRAINAYATNCFDVSDYPHVYQVIWDQPVSISDQLRIDPALVARRFPSE